MTWLEACVSTHGRGEPRPLRQLLLIGPRGVHEVSTHGRGEPRPLPTSGASVFAAWALFQPTAGANPGRCTVEFEAEAQAAAFQPTAGANPGRCVKLPWASPSCSAVFQPTAGANPGRCLPGTRPRSR